MDFGDLKESFNDWYLKFLEYFTHLSKDLLYSWIAVGVGLFLLLLGMILW